MAETIIQIRDLTKTYAPTETAPVSALNGVTLDIEQGEFVALTGASGAGKSTLLNLIGLLDDPTSGEILVQGVNINHFNEKQRTLFRLQTVGFIFQFFNLIENYTAAENIAFQLELQGENKGAAEKKSLEILQYLKLADKAHLYPKNLSGGEQQRVAIGRALAKEPLILLADEPTAHLDSKNAALIMDILHHINQTFGNTIILVTHEPSQADQAHKKVIMQDGRVLEIQTKQPL